MKKNKKKDIIQEEVIVPYIPPEHTHYAHYYEETGQILSVSNERDLDFTHAIEISHQEYANIASGRERFEDFYVGSVIDKTGNPVLGLISKKELRPVSSIRYQEIVYNGIEDAELTVHWAQGLDQWVFVMSDDARSRYYKKQISSDPIVFFIVLENNLDALIKTITINPSDLILDKIIISFDHLLEQQIDRISILANTTSLVTTLKIWRINE